MPEMMGFEKNRRFVVDWHNKPETVTIGGQTCHFKSQQEKKWANYLQLLKDLGEIRDWLYESRTFWFEEIRRGVTSYKPDFRVTYPPKALKEIDEIDSWSLSICPKCSGSGEAYREDPSIACGECGGHGAMPYLWHEVKVHLVGKDITKFRRMAKYYPDEKLILVLNRPPKKQGQRNLLRQAEKYVYRVMYANELLGKAGIK